MIIVFGNMANSFIDDSKAKQLYAEVNKILNLTQNNVTLDDLYKNPYLIRSV